MNIPPIFAEDIPPTVLLVFLVPLLLGVFAVRFIVVSKRARRASPAGLVARLVPVLIGGVILLSLLTVRGGAPGSFLVVAAFPVAAGLLGIYVWGRKSPEAARTTAITFRLILYGCFALALIYLCFVLLKRS